MEKNQHNSSTEAMGEHNNNGFTGDQPGQRQQADTSQTIEPKSTESGKDEKHSESSFPQQDNETLGTP